MESATGLPLGIGNGEFSEQCLALGTGTRFVLYSDGVSEANNAEFEEYGTSRIRHHFEQSTSSVESLLRDVHQFAAGVPLADDATVVLIDSATS